MLYKFGRALFQLYFFLFHRVNVEGREKIPKTGPLLIYANHPNVLDMFLLAVNMPRQVYYMAKAELFENWFLAAILRGLGAFPVNRGKGDIGSVKTVLKLLKAEKTVGIFPEGTRSRGKDPKRRKGGAALFAYKTGVPVLPVGIDGNFKLFGKLRMVIGDPFVLEKPGDGHPTKEDLTAATGEIIDKIYALIGK